MNLSGETGLSLNIDHTFTTDIGFGSNPGRFSERVVRQIVNGKPVKFTDGFP